MSEPYVVFADVDETIIRCKSMVAFLEHFLQVAPASVVAQKRGEVSALRAAHAQSANRAALNRSYYTIFRGIRRAELESIARDWGREVMRRGDLFIASTRGELAEHRAAGAELVLVSGSFRELIEPIAEEVGASTVLCTELEAIDGTYTGELAQQVIGEGKWEVVRRHMKRRSDVPLSRCYAYGDHVSDVSFMEKVGHPVVVGAATAMLEIARQRRWRVLRDTPDPSPPMATVAPDGARTQAAKEEVR